MSAASAVIERRVTTSPELVLVSDGLMHEIEARPGLSYVDDEFGGRTFPDDGKFGYDNNPEMRKILGFGGVTFEERTDAGGTYLGARLPDPERLLACCEANDIPIKFLASTDPDGDIPWDDFADAVRAGDGPVGVDNLPFYMHDLAGEIHFPAVIVGGRPLLEWIVKNAPKDEHLAAVYDLITPDITSMLEKLFSSSSTASSIDAAARKVLNRFKAKSDPTKNDFERPMSDTERAMSNELRTILYNGLERRGFIVQTY